MKFLDFFKKASLPIVLVGIFALVGVSPGNGTFTSSSSNPLVVDSSDCTSIAFEATGTTGPIDVYTTLDGSAAIIGTDTTPIKITDVFGNVISQPMTPVSGTMYRITPPGGTIIISPDPTFSGNMTVKAKCLAKAGDNGPLNTVNPPPYIPYYYGSGTNTYEVTGPDTEASALVAAAGTLQLFTVPASTNLYIFLLAYQASGTNTTNNPYAEWSLVSGCASGTHVIAPLGYVMPAGTGGQWDNFVSGSSIPAASGADNSANATWPTIIPSQASTVYVCGVTTGSAVSGYFVWHIATHAN